MTTTGNPIIAAIFQDEDTARKAMNDLQESGFSNDQIRYSVHRGGTGITDSLISLGLTQQEADFYNNQFEAGKTIVTVNTNDRQQEAYNILVQDGGKSANTNYAQGLETTTMPASDTAARAASNRVSTNVDQAAKNVAQTGSTVSSETVNTATGQGLNTTTGQTANTTTAGANTVPGEAAGTTMGQGLNTTAGQTANAVTGNQTENVQLREEQLQANKQRVQAGEVGLRKEVVTEQQTINVPVSREEVVIEHHPGSGQASDQPIGEGETIRIPVSEEQVNVTKETVPTGEVTIGKRQVQETQQVSDTVRREEARLVQEGDVDIEGGNVQGVNDTQP